MLKSIEKIKIKNLRINEMKKVLIVYGTRYGSTEEVSKKIAEILRENEILASIQNLKKIKSKSQLNLEGYEGLIIGSGIKVGKWTKETRKFLEYNLEIFKSTSKILGVFVSSGFASNPQKIEELKVEYIEKVLNQYEIKADLLDVFGGVLDLSKESNLNSLEKKMIRMVSKNDPNIKPHQKNDFRNWEQIHEFAVKFANLVKSV